MYRIKYIFVTLISLVLFSGCVTSYQPKPATNYQNYQLKISMLEKQVQQLQKQIEQLENKKRAVKTGEEKAQILYEINKLSQKQQKNLSYLEQIKKEIAELKSGIANKQKERNNNITQPVVIKHKYQPKKTKRYKYVKKVKKKKIINPDDEYIKCYKLYVKNQYKESERCFTRFLSKFPKSHLISNAYFWIGETYFARKNYPKAIDYYDIILTKFLKSEKVPAALLKEGLSFYELHDNEGAKIFLEKVISDFPNTPQAKWAKNYLKKYNLNKLR